MQWKEWFRTKIILVSLFVAILVSLSIGPLFLSDIVNANAEIFTNQRVITNESLINPDELNALIKTKTVKIIDVRSPEQYQKGHLPGAVNIWLNDYKDANGLVPSPERFSALLSKLGVDNNDTIALYSGSDKHDPAYVAHFWWLLDMFGDHNVKTLDGGLAAWQASGYQLTDEISTIDPKHFQVGKVDTSKLATTEDVLSVVESPDPKVIILDVRELAEFTGAVQAPGAARKGRIPGAVWLYWGDTLNPDKTLKNVDELRTLFAAKGITPDKTVIIYCQAGVRAAHTTYVLSELLGYKNVKNYAGSWIEWSHRADLPLEIGER